MDRLFILLFGLTAVPAFATADLAKTKNCLTCHAVDAKVIGPSFKDVARRYVTQPGTEQQLVKKVLKGGAGSWGAVPMPANMQLTESEAKVLVHWILSLR